MAKLIERMVAKIKRRDVALMICDRKPHGAYLSSDHAESFVPTRLFSDIGQNTALMNYQEAQDFGLEDGAT